MKTFADCVMTWLKAFDDLQAEPGDCHSMNWPEAFETWRFNIDTNAL